MPKIAISAGHHNLTGGHKTEIELVGLITAAVAEQCRALDMDVRVITPKNGLGTFNGGLRQVAQTVVDWAADGWVADYFLELHAEDNGAGNLGRGCFVIFPDVGADVDTGVRDTIGPMIAHAIRDYTKIPLRGAGVMSERKTHVFTNQHARLGIFEVTAVLREQCQRMIVEVGAYSSFQDLKIMRGADFPVKVGRAIAHVLAGHEPEEQHHWYEVVVDVALTREGPGRGYPEALHGEARFKRGDVFAGDQVVRGELVGNSPYWIHRKDQIGFVSATLVKEDRRG